MMGYTGIESERQGWAGYMLSEDDGGEYRAADTCRAARRELTES